MGELDKNLANAIGNEEEVENNEETSLAPGLYETGTTTMIKSWEELKDENLITVEGTTLAAIDWDLAGDLVISSEIENLSSYYYYEEWRRSKTRRK